MKIAILGWGSLIWDPRDLPREGTWQEGGPKLPIEFSRISSDARLTLVIDSDNGEFVPTQYVYSPRADLDDAIRDLRAREGAEKKEGIGFVNLTAEPGKDVRCRVEKLAKIIKKWAKENNFDAVVWTDLGPNFKKELNTDFSLDSAKESLEGLPKNVAEKARKYINNAPPEVDTPLRKRLRKSGWLKSP